MEQVVEGGGLGDASEPQAREMKEMKLASSELARNKGHMRTLLVELKSLVT